MTPAEADLGLLRAARGALGRAGRLRDAVRVFSRAGEHGACWLAIGATGAALDAPRRERWLRGAAAVGGGYVLNTLVKLVVRRRRPELPDLPPLMPTHTRLSFPSAHATTSFAGARAYAALVPAGPLYALAVAMASTRVLLGVHYPSDIAAGAALGTVLGGLAR